jgi:hypothetical protein
MTAKHIFKHISGVLLTHYWKCFILKVIIVRLFLKRVMHRVIHVNIIKQSGTRFQTTNKKCNWREAYKIGKRELNNLYPVSFNLLSLFWENKSKLMRSCCCLCVCLCIPLIIARQWLGKNPPIVARQRLGRNVTAVTNTQATIGDLSDASISMWPVSYQGK